MDNSEIVQITTWCKMYLCVINFFFNNFRKTYPPADVKHIFYLLWPYVFKHHFQSNYIIRVNPTLYECTIIWTKFQKIDRGIGPEQSYKPEVTFRTHKRPPFWPQSYVATLAHLWRSSATFQKGPRRPPGPPPGASPAYFSGFRHQKVDNSTLIR